jgi:integrase
VRRGYGTGTLRRQTDSQGREWWYGRWHNGVGRPNRKLGPVRTRGGEEGLTRREAEQALRKLIESDRPIPAGTDITIEECGERLLRHLEAKGLKPTTLETYASVLKTHVYPALGNRSLQKTGVEEVEGLLTRMRREGKSVHMLANALKRLHQIYVFGMRRRWCADNPCALVDPPALPRSTDIRFLDEAELGALLRAVDPDSGLFASTDHAIFLTAAMSGLRQGELLALRWCDVDWQAAKIRVRRNYVRGHWLPPKSRRGSRAVPLADQVAGELDRHHRRSAYTGDEDLVFAHPETGAVLDHSALVRRFKKALRGGGVRTVRFHDLRHTFGTRMAAEGVPPSRLQEWMGHRDLKTTLIYVDYAPADDERRTVTDAFSEVRVGDPSDPMTRSHPAAYPGADAG